MAHPLVFGVPTYNPTSLVLGAITSMALQSCGSNVLLVDDCSTSDCLQLLNTLVDEFPNVHLVRQTQRVGQLRNTNDARLFAIEAFPESRYFALGSDHDIWHPDFGLHGINALSMNNSGYFVPRHKRVTVEEAAREKIDWSPGRAPDDLGGLGSSRVVQRLFGADLLAAGSMIYGLQDLNLLRNLKFYRAALGPDRLFLYTVLARTNLCTAPQTLWCRVSTSSFSRHRQLENLFPSSSGPQPCKFFTRHTELHHTLLLIKSIESFGDCFLVLGPAVRNFKMLFRGVCRRLLSLTRAQVFRILATQRKIGSSSKRLREGIRLRVRKRHVRSHN